MKNKWCFTCKLQPLLIKEFINSDNEFGLTKNKIYKAKFILNK